MPKESARPELELLSGHMSYQDHVVEQVMQPPKPQEVFSYNNDQWQFDSQVVNWFREKDPVKHPNGVTLYRDVAEMTDGNKYQVHSLVPSNQKTDVPVVKTTPWLMSDRGHSRYTDLQIAELGYPVVEFGPEGNYRESVIKMLGNFTLRAPELWKQVHQIELARTAHNMHQILNLRGGHPFYDPSQVVLAGESRGAMVAFGVEAFADEHGRQPIYADLSAPCFATPLKKEDLWDYRGQLPAEIRSLRNIAKGFPMRRLRHYPDSLNLSPQALLYQIFTGPTLFSGQTGELADNIPLDRMMYINAFNGDIAGQGEQWQEKFADHPGVKVDIHDGSHISLAEPATLERFLGRLSSLLGELDRADGNASDVNYERIHLNSLTRAA